MGALRMKLANARDLDDPAALKKMVNSVLDGLGTEIEGLRHLIAEVGVSQIVMGTDYPFPWTKTAVDHILTTPGLSDAERVAILGETAANLLAIKPA